MSAGPVEILVREAWEEALRLAPDSEEIRRNLEALEGLRR